MKKIFTLLVTAAIMGSAFAQYDSKEYRNNKDRNDGYKEANIRRYDKHDDKFGSTYYFSEREKDMQLAQINREYDYRIRSVWSSFFKNRFQKMRQVEFLKEQKNKEICAVMDKFNDRRNLFNRQERRYKDKW